MRCYKWNVRKLSELTLPLTTPLQDDVDEESLSTDEQKERKIMKLLLKIKNGTPPMRKVCPTYSSPTH